MIPCPTCGNEIDPKSQLCRFCGTDISAQDTTIRKKTVLHKTINLKLGRPVVETALKRLELELGQARRQNVRVLTLIHGYGSSGKGGRIRIECRKMLDHLMYQGALSGFIPGEKFNRKSGPGKSLVRQFGDLAKVCESDFNNPGVTIVVM